MFYDWIYHVEHDLERVQNNFKPTNIIQKFKTFKENEWNSSVFLIKFGSQE